MIENKNKDIDFWNNYFGVEYCNRVFQFFSRENLNPSESLEMLSLAHASYLHWQNNPKSTVLNTQRAYYLLAKSYLKIEINYLAKIYTENCIEYTFEHIDKMKNFDVVYAMEIMCRYSAMTQNKNDFKKYSKISQEYIQKIENKDDLELVKKDISEGKWYGENYYELFK